MGITADQIAILGSRVAKNVFETNGAKIIITAEIAKTIKSLITNAALIYSLVFSYSPLAQC